jgi:tetratricopeptide (TPR) repeat protein
LVAIEWIDKYRYLLMISASPLTYREIVLGNKAYCLLRLGRVKESKELYEAVLAQYPENGNAEAQLALINIVSESVLAELRATAALS